jgi:hypothetical protein
VPVVGQELIPASQRACFGVERDHRVGVEVGTGVQGGEEIRRGVAGGDV